jgi:hypothetical protein
MTELTKLTELTATAERGVPMQLDQMRTTRDQRSRMREFILYVPRSLPSQAIYIPPDGAPGEGLTVTRAYVSARIDRLRRHSARRGGGETTRECVSRCRCFPRVTSGQSVIRSSICLLPPHHRCLADCRHIAVLMTWLLAQAVMQARPFVSRA